MTDPYQNYPSGPQYGPPGTGPDLGKHDSGQQYQQPQYQQPYPGGPNAQQPYAGGGYGYPAPMPGYNPGDPEAPYGRDMYGVPFSDKQKVLAGLLQIFLGGFGVGRFYTGHTSIAVWQIAATWLTCGIGGIWPFIDGIMMLMGKVTDQYGRPLRD
ncbi:TM2 domain-containing protein [Nocardia donostiensis]|uniref:TM2 domain-containing protein n=1 Tax=Nocardia donostiensis TaxID=1538463 RepID=A0A1W0ASL5_9NOCA|nr:TM2 domain-containing protein [Nocardia donostiensis]ONM46885.1 hypothetical protein B0T46_20630 [Nocardia donostiensis]OQS13234.1 hypothetical protein B0T36_20675 [Nocardia donostiensis]OQS19144.1 hypothetical protein B0T44_15930 [Nocardia donostiensis]